MRVVITCLMLLVWAPWSAAQGTPPGDQDQDQDLEGRIIQELRFLGAPNVDETSLRAKLRTKSGAPYSRKQLDDDIRYLREQLKLFSTIDVPKPQLLQNGQLIVSFYVTENPRIAFVSILGNEEYTHKEVLDLIETTEGGLADEITLKLDQRKIIDKYKSDGYHFVQVDYEKKLHPDFGTTIVFTITEGPECEIDEVRFQGNVSFDKGELLEAMPGTDESGLLFGTNYNENDVDADIVQLQRFYRGHGFLDAKVTLIDRIFSPDKEEVDLVIKIEEGTPYMVNSVRIEGMERFDPGEIMAEMKTQPGQRYEQLFTLIEDIRAIRSKYFDEAYINVRVIDDTIIPDAGYDVDVVLNVVEGNIVYIGDIHIEGNIDTKDKVIRRALEDLAPGRPMNQNTLDRARRRLQRLGYFEADRLAVLRPPIGLEDYQLFRDAYLQIEDTPRENVKDIRVQVEEVDTGSVRFSVGIGSNAGLVGSILYTKENFDPLDFPEGWDDILDAFTGGGQRLQILAAPGFEISQYSLQYSNPYFFDTNFDFSFRIFKRFAFRENWDEDRTGFSVGFGRRFGFNISTSVTYRLELVDVDDIDDDAGQIVFDFEGENLISAIAWHLTIAELDFADGHFAAVSGYQLSTTYEYAGLGGDIKFNRVNLDGNYYISLFQDSEDRHHVVSISGRGGWVEETGGVRDVPIYERFFAGGHGSLRGFDFRGVGPMTHGSPDGGKVLILGSVEYIFPVYENVLRGVVFLDTGTLARDFQDPDLENFRVSVGFGIRLTVPFLGPQPFAIDFGFPLLKYGDDETRLISFSLERKF